MKKYEFTGKTKMFLGKKLFQIRALVNFGYVEAGEIGGYIEKEENLSHYLGNKEEKRCRVRGKIRMSRQFVRNAEQELN